MSILGRRDPPLVPGWARAAALVALAIFLSCWAWSPMFVLYPGTSIEDGHMFHFYVASSKATLRYYHELPLWNPFDCKGIPLWDYPENITASPIFFLTVGLTTTQTIMVWNIFHVAAGFVGMWLLARSELRLGRAAALVAACFWAFGAGHTSQYAGEHEALISFLDAPILLLLWRRAERSWNAAVGCGLAIGWMVYDGATYGLPFTVLVLALETLTRLWPVRRIPRILAAAAIVGVVGGLVGASRLLPIMAQFSYHKRPISPDVDVLSWQTLRDMYMLRSPHWRSHFNEQQYVFGEYVTYIGWLGVILALLGLALSAESATWLLVWAAMIFALMLGHFSDKAPWSLLNAHVFPFKAMRVPARFRLLMMVPISLWIAFATERVPVVAKRLFGRKWAAASGVVVLGAALLCAGDVVGLGQEIMMYRFTAAPEVPGLTRSRTFYYGGPGLAGDFIDNPRQNRGWLGCRSYEWSFNTSAGVWEGDVPQARATDAETTTVTNVTRTHNRFSFDVDAQRPTRVVLNSAHDPGWRTNVGETAIVNGQLAVDVPAGLNHVEVRYWPKYLTLGFWLSGLSLLGSILFFFRKKLRKR
jgi:hypothetical protein